MRISDKGLKFLKQEEGEKLVAYKDVAGIPTISVGITRYENGDKVKMGDKITKERSAELLKDYLLRLEIFLTSVIKVPVTQNQFDAILSLTFNIGNTAFKGSSVLKRLNQRLYTSAAEAFLMWDKATVNKKKVKVEALANRRKRERALFLTP